MNYKILLVSGGVAVGIVALKYVVHLFGFEPIEQSSLHNGIISSVTFVMGFLLAATISDYKESERIPAEFAANIEDMYADAMTIHQSYPKFNLEGFRLQLLKIAHKFEDETRSGKRGMSQNIRELNMYFAEMESAGVPANYIVKLKQQQLTLMKSRKRVTYIQRIHFIPSANILLKSIVFLLLILLVLTNVDPFVGGMAIIGITSFTMIYMLLLIKIISTPFHTSGSTRDDVSLFLIEGAAENLNAMKK